MQLQPWVAPYCANYNNSLRTFGAEVTPEAGLVITNPDITDETVKALAVRFSDLQAKNVTVTTFTDRWIGQLLLDHLARKQTTVEEAISQLDLIEITGKSQSTLTKLARIVSLLPPEVFSLPNLTTVHYDVVTSYGGPNGDPEAMRGFSDERVSLLQKISENPKAWTKPNVKTAMKDLQARYNVVSHRRESLSTVTDQFVAVSLLLIEATEDQLTAHGTTRVELMDRYNDLREKLKERHMAPDSLDPDDWSPPWIKKITRDVDATIVDGDITETTNEAGDDIENEVVAERFTVEDDDETGDEVTTTGDATTIIVEEPEEPDL